MKKSMKPHDYPPSCLFKSTLLKNDLKKRALATIFFNEYGKSGRKQHDSNRQFSYPYNEH